MKKYFLIILTLFSIMSCQQKTDQNIEVNQTDKITSFGKHSGLNTPEAFNNNVVPLINENKQ